MEQDLLDISNGRLYSANDMVRVGCRDCVGCSECCRGMGDSILLDPYDIHRLSLGLSLSFEELLQGPVELHLEEGLILPNLKMTGEENPEPASETESETTSETTLGQKNNDTGHVKNACFFLNEKGRCSIHSIRPGICRLFPMGRNYELREDGSYRLSYFLLEGECPVPNKSKIKVSKWLDTPGLRQYEHYLELWHQITKHMRSEVTAEPEQAEKNRRTTMLFLQYFYQKPYTEGHFFEEFKARADALLSVH